MTLHPLTITATLGGPVVMGASFGIALDGLLAALTRIEGTPPGERPSSADGGLRLGDPSEPDLPLARCGNGEDWHWMATTALPLGPAGTPMPVEPVTHHRSVHFAQRPAERAARTIPATVPVRAGRFRSRLIPTVTFTCAALTWRCVGDPDQIRHLLTRAHSIGGARGSGHGAVTHWEIAPAHDLAPYAAGHLHRDGALGRPVPDRCLPLHLTNRPAEKTYAGLRPPYFHPARQRLLTAPTYPQEI